MLAIRQPVLFLVWLLPQTFLVTSLITRPSPARFPAVSEYQLQYCIVGEYRPDELSQPSYLR